MPVPSVGAYLTPQAPVDADHVAGSRQLLRHAERAEAAGLDGVFLAEHLTGDDYAFYESLALLSAIAGRTDRVDLGTAIAIAPLHHPVRFAARAATIDALSGGRFVAGFGTGGGRATEYSAFDVADATAIQRTTETVELIQRLWAEDGVSHDGAHYSVADVTLHPKPVQTEVPVWFGFNGERGLHHIARSDAGWLALSQVPRATLEGRVETLRRALAEHGRSIDDVDMAILLEVSVADDRGTAVEAIREPAVAKYREYASRERQPAAVQGLEPAAVTFEHIEDLFVVGTPESVAADLAYYRDLGFDYLCCRPPVLGDDEAAVARTIELLGEAVRPRLRR